MVSDFHRMRCLQQEPNMSSGIQFTKKVSKVACAREITFTAQDFDCQSEQGSNSWKISIISESEPNRTNGSKNASQKKIHKTYTQCKKNPT